MARGRFNDPNYKNLTGLDEERRYALTSFKQPANTRFESISGEIPGTELEKKVYDYLKRIGVRFQYQYNVMNSSMTSFNESRWKQAFILPDMNNTMIDIYDNYFHSSYQDLRDDQLKNSYISMMGYRTISRGIVIEPLSSWNGGYYIIWREDELRYNFDHVVQRDLPDLAAYSGKTTEDPYLQDPKVAWQRIKDLEKRRIMRRLVPRAPTTRPKSGPRLPKKPVKDRVASVSQAPYESEASGRLNR